MFALLVVFNNKVFPEEYREILYKKEYMKKTFFLEYLLRQMPERLADAAQFRAHVRRLL